MNLNDRGAAVDVRWIQSFVCLSSIILHHIHLIMTLSDNPNEFKLDNAPTDCIQSVKFGLSSNQYLIAASWDCTVRLYDITNNTFRCKYTHQSPVLDCAFQVSSIVFHLEIHSFVY